MQNYISTNEELVSTSLFNRYQSIKVSHQLFQNHYEIKHFIDVRMIEIHGPLGGISVSECNEISGGAIVIEGILRPASCWAKIFGTCRQS